MVLDSGASRRHFLGIHGGWRPSVDHDAIEDWLRGRRAANLIEIRIWTSARADG
jgi:hypothetical protein